MITSLSVYLISGLRLLPPANRIVSSIQSINYLKPFVLNLQKDFKKFSSHNSLSENKKIFKISNFNNLNFKNINFQYSKKKIIFKNANLKLKKFKNLGFFGLSGSGKSSLIKILTGQLPMNCNLSIYGKVYNLNHYINIGKVSYVPQKIHIINGSILDNIVLSNISEKVNLVRIKKCLIDVQLKEFIEVFNKKKLFEVKEGGYNLSGGQIQRLGIARALYNNPDFLIFDESTNALDQNNKEKILNLIKRITRNKTVILVSHDKEVLKICDEVYEIKNKKIYAQK